MNSNSVAGSYLIYLVILAVVLTLSSYRSLYGRKYRPFRTFLRPLLYLLLGLSVLTQDFSGSLLLVSLTGLLAGIAVGGKLGSGVSFYYSGTELYYKRSPWVYLIWLGSFIARVYVETLSSISTLDTTILDSLLLFSSGLLLGESYHVVMKVKSLRKGYG